MDPSKTLHEMLKSGGSYGLLAFDPQTNSFSLPTVQGGRKSIPWSMAEIVVKKFRGMVLYDAQKHTLKRV